MNLDEKYFIRWGIPGWVFILFVILIYLALYPEIISFNPNFLEILGFFVSAGFIGVPIGYLFHQIYFSINWLTGSRTFENSIDLIEKKELIKGCCWGKNSFEDYYRFEYFWERELLKISSDKRDYIVERYRYFLNTKHALGALCISLVSTLLFFIVMLIYFEPKIKTPFLLSILIIFIFFLLVAVFKGFKYYSKNLEHFQGYLLNDLLNGEFVENCDQTN